MSDLTVTAMLILIGVVLGIIVTHLSSPQQPATIVNVSPPPETDNGHGGGNISKFVLLLILLVFAAILVSGRF